MDMLSRMVIAFFMYVKLSKKLSGCCFIFYFSEFQVKSGMHLEIKLSTTEKSNKSHFFKTKFLCTFVK